MTAEAVLVLRMSFLTWDPCPDAPGRTWHHGHFCHFIDLLSNGCQQYSEHYPTGLRL
ncbi:26318_t:CDS:2 [Gigaspora rosea]|nr:26318_t:CDS:2 [Gigaspora rosea]